MTKRTRRDPLIEWLFELRGPSLKWDIETAEAFTAWLGHPHRRYACVHVAGTNGKGSVSAMLHAIAGAAGLEAGLFTSPHLVRPEERIRVGAEEIDAGRFRKLVTRLRDEAAAALRAGALPRHPSFFEMMTAAAMVAFAERPVALGVFEAGLGGRLDATNVLHPLLSVVTTVSPDHLKTLGGSLEAIAREKAGIFKPGIPVLAGWISGPPFDVLERRARAVGAPFHAAAKELRLTVHADGRFDLDTPERSYRRLSCALAGEHQARNAALAVRAAELARQRGLPVSEEAAEAGLAAVRWPGRLESVPASPEIVLDAAHNVAGAEALGRALRARDGREGRPGRRVLVLAVTDGRDPMTLVRPLGDGIDRVVATRPGTPRARDPQEVAALLGGGAAGVEAVEDVPGAIERARELAGPDGQVVVAGSLYLVGDARAAILSLDGPGHVRRERVPDLDAAPPDRRAV